MNEKDEYNKLTVEAAVGAWIVKEKGEPTKVFLNWDKFVSYLKSRLAN